MVGDGLFVHEYPLHQTETALRAVPLVSKIPHIRQLIF
jgi:hypothetical protein